MFSINQPAFVNCTLPNAFELTNFTPAAVQAFAKYLAKLHADEIPLSVINVNSSGGDADCLYSFLSLMKEYKKKGIEFCGIVAGFAFSAGAYVFLYCNEGRRYMGDLGNLMLHGLQLGQNYDRLSTLKNNIEVSAAQQSVLFKEISKNLKKKPDWLEKEMQKRGQEDWYISAAEAEKMGFAKIALPEFQVNIRAEFSIVE